MNKQKEILFKINGLIDFNLPAIRGIHTELRKLEILGKLIEEYKLNKRI